MPNINTTMYLTDEDYQKFLKRKREILDKMREFIRDELGIERKSGSDTKTIKKKIKQPKVEQSKVE